MRTGLERTARSQDRSGHKVRGSDSERTARWTGLERTVEKTGLCWRELFEDRIGEDSKITGSEWTARQTDFERTGEKTALYCTVENCLRTGRGHLNRQGGIGQERRVQLEGQSSEKTARLHKDI